MRLVAEGNAALITECVLKLGRHFEVEVPEDQLEIFVKALATCSPHQIQTAFDACIAGDNRCETMPKLADVHKRLPEVDPTEKPSARKWGFYQQQPLGHLSRSYAEIVSPYVCGKEYAALDIRTDAVALLKVSFAATRLRFEEMGNDTETWKRGEPKHVDVKEFIARLSYPQDMPILKVQNVATVVEKQDEKNTEPEFTFSPAREPGEDSEEQVHGVEASPEVIIDDSDLPDIFFEPAKEEERKE